MPYIQVWVDDHECDGECGRAKQVEHLRDVIAEAEQHLRYGDVECALLTLTENRLFMAYPAEMAAKYSQWQAGRLPGYTNYVEVATDV